MTITCNFLDEVKAFVDNHEVLCFSTFGLAVAVYASGNLAGRAVSWISEWECLGMAKKTDDVGRELISTSNNGDSSLIATHPNETLKEIFSYLNYDQLRMSACVSLRWQEVANDPILSKMAIYKHVAFGPLKWAECLGDETLKTECEQAFAYLPDNISELRKELSRVFEGKTIGQTEVLVWIPGSLTINALGKLLKKVLSNSLKGYSYLIPPGGDEYDQASGESRWVSMTIEVIPGSRGRRYKCLETKVANLNYEVPKGLEAVACIVARFIQSGKKEYLFGLDSKTYTHVQEGRGQRRLVVGGFDSCGLRVMGFGPGGLSVKNCHGNLKYGVAVLRKL